MREQWTLSTGVGGCWRASSCRPIRPPMGGPVMRFCCVPTLARISSIGRGDSRQGTRTGVRGPRLGPVVFGVPTGLVGLWWHPAHSLGDCCVRGRCTPPADRASRDRGDRGLRGAGEGPGPRVHRSLRRMPCWPRHIERGGWPIVDWAARASACRAALDGELGPDRLLFHNIEPIALGSECPPDLRPDISRPSGRFQIVLEVTERSLGHDPRALLNGIDRQRPGVAAWRWMTSGSGTVTVALLAVLAVDVIKLDRSITQGGLSGVVEDPRHGA